MILVIFKIARGIGVKVFPQNLELLNFSCLQKTVVNSNVLCQFLTIFFRTLYKVLQQNNAKVAKEPNACPSVSRRIRTQSQPVLGGFRAEPTI